MKKWYSSDISSPKAQEFPLEATVVKMSQQNSGFEISELRNAKYELLCKRWKSSGKINFRVREYEETGFIQMMYKLFSPKFLPVF